MFLEHTSGEFAKGASRRISGVMQCCEMALPAEKGGTCGPLSRVMCDLADISRGSSCRVYS